MQKTKLFPLKEGGVLLKSQAALLMMLGLLVGSIFAQSPTPPNVIQDWQFLGEAPSSVDVDYRVAQCGETPEIQLLVFNEGRGAVNLEYSLKITSGAKSTTQNFAVNLAHGGMYKGDCDANDDLKPYHFAVPMGYDPNDLQVEITFTKETLIPQSHE